MRMRRSWFSCSSGRCSRASSSRCCAWAPARRASVSACSSSSASSSSALSSRSVSTCASARASRRAAGRARRMQRRDVRRLLRRRLLGGGAAGAAGRRRRCSALRVARRTMKRRSRRDEAAEARVARSSMPYWPGRGKRDGSISNGLSRRPRSMRWPLPVSVACIGCGPSQLTVTGPVMIAPSAGDRISRPQQAQQRGVHQQVGAPTTAAALTSATPATLRTRMAHSRESRAKSQKAREPS